MLSILIVGIIFGICVYSCNNITNFDKKILDISNKRNKND